MDYIDDKLRKLANTSYWQNLYGMFKDGANMSLFINKENYSGLQARFCYWLQIYSMLYEELMKHESDFLSDAVINDNVRCDAYLISRNKKHDALWQKYRREEKASEHKSKHPGKHKEGNVNLIDVDLRRT